VRKVSKVEMSKIKLNQNLTKQEQAHNKKKKEQEK